MIWAAQIPDRDAICIDGISAKLSQYTEMNWSELDDVLNIIKEECPNAFAELVCWASREVAEGYSDFLTRKYDS
jgi:uncharacterized protein (UPF0276 family)